VGHSQNVSVVTAAGTLAPMRVAVIGATGNLGTSVVDALAAHDSVHDIVGVARRLPDLTVPKTRFVARDVRGDDLAPDLHGVDVVVHAAWFFQPTHRPLVTWQNNVGGTERILDAVARAGVPAVVYVSSVGAYSPGPGRRVDESWPTDSVPTAGYGREKAYVERMLDAFAARHPDTRVVRFRPSFLFKERAASEQRRIFAGPFVPNAAARAVPVLPYPEGLRFQAMHTDDAADACCRAVVSASAEGAYNLAAEPVLDGELLAELLGARLLEVPPGVVRFGLASAWHLRLAPAEPALFDLVRMLPLLDATRARVDLGWEPRRSSVEAVREFLAGLAAGAGAATAPLRADSWPARARELVAGVGTRPA